MRIKRHLNALGKYVYVSVRGRVTRITPTSQPNEQKKHTALRLLYLLRIMFILVYDYKYFTFVQMKFDVKES